MNQLVINYVSRQTPRVKIAHVHQGRREKNNVAERNMTNLYRLNEVLHRLIIKIKKEGEKKA